MSIPKAPAILPPMVTEAKTHIPGRPIVFPTTLGYIKFPSICCKMIINTMNQNAWAGFISNIKNAPIAVPIKAPNIGIRAVAPTNADIMAA